MKRLFNKRVASIVLATVLAIGTLAGCSGGTDTANNGETVTLTWLVPGEAHEGTSMVMEKVNEKLPELIGAKLDLQFIDPSAYDEKMTLNMASGNTYDLAFAGYVNDFYQAVEKGGVMCLDKYLKDTDFYKNLPDYVATAGTVDGKLYGIPNQQIMANAKYLFVQEKLANEYGLDTESIKTLDDIEPFLKWVKQNYPNLYPFRASELAYYITEANFNEYYDQPTKGVYIVEGEDGKPVVKSALDVDFEKNLAELLSDWYAKGYIRSDVASVTSDWDDYNAGKYAVSLTSYKPGAVQESNNKGLEPVIGIQLGDGYLPFDAGSAAMTVVGANSKNPEKAAKFIELINTNEEIYNLICYGIEGTHYELVDGKFVRYIADSGYMPNASWKFGNQFKAYPLEGQDEDVWEQTEAFNNNSKRSALLGFNFDNSNVKSQVMQIENIVSKYKVLKTGAEPLNNYYDKYAAEMKAAGVDDVVAEVQKQLDEFLSK